MKIRRRLHLENIDLLGPIVTLVLKSVGLYQRGVRNALNVQLTELELRFPNLPAGFDGYTILHVSDLHLNGAPLLAGILVDVLAGVDADVAVFTGDYNLRFCRDWRSAIPPLREVLAAVRVRDGVWGVRGNHDPAEMMLALEELGVEVLGNEATVLRRGSDEVWLAGVDDPHFYEAADLGRALSAVPNNAFLILLAHTPELYREAQQAGVNLYLCGHTHGGQFQVPGLGPLFLNIRAPRRYGSGLWRVDGMWGYTNLGAGNTTVPVRFGCRPEVALIRLRRGS